MCRKSRNPSRRLYSTTEASAVRTWSRGEVAAGALMRPPLADQLVGQATVQPLVVPGLFPVQLLDVVLAVPEQLVVRAAAPVEELAQLDRGVLVLQKQRHLLRGR